MSEDLQGLLEKINREGVEKAQERADRIIADAEARASAIVKKAREEAESARAAAKADAAGYSERAAETVRQAARDIVLQVGSSVRKLLENVLLKDVEASLADPALAANLAADAVKEVASGAEISAPAKLADSLRSALAASGRFKVVLDESTEAGFTVRADGGRVEFSFTPEAIAGELARRLRPDLAAIVGGISVK